MKSFKIIFWLGMAILPFLAGCPQKRTVTTKVNTDGSLLRTIGNFDQRKFEGIDSVRRKLPVPVDTSWTLESIDDSTAVLWKKYENVEALNTDYAEDQSALSQCHRQVAFSKQFRWFFTFYKYSETYTGILTDIPLNHYLLEEEITALKSPDSDTYFAAKNLTKAARSALSDNMDERLGFWLNDQMFAIAFDDILHIADSLQLITTPANNYQQVKDSVKHFLDNNDKNMVSFDLENDTDFGELAGIIGKYISMDSSANMLLQSTVKQMDLTSKYEDMIFFGLADDYHHHLIMPGQLMETNAEQVGGDTLKWDITFIKYIDSDYVIYAESRITNVWAYFVSALIVITALYLLFVPRRT